jgi:hypothetical protein
VNSPRNLFELAGRLQRSGRNPLAVYLLGLCIAAGLSFIAGILTGSGTMKPIEHLMPGGLVASWYLLLFGGGLTAITGIMLRDLVYSLLIERAGLIALTTASVVYAAALAFFGDYLTCVTLALFAGACLWRIWQVRRELAHIRGRA